MLRAVTLILALLLLVITSTSAYLRFAQAGLGCADWPGCYGPSTAPEPALSESDPLFVPRALHRVAASLAGVLVVLVVFLGWNAWTRTRRRVAATALLVLTALLAWIGQYTPSPLPAVTIANLLGGMALFAIALRLVPAGGAPAATASTRPLAPLAHATLLIAILQIGLGGLIAARYGAAACDVVPWCSRAPWALEPSARVFDPFDAGTAFDAGALQAVHVAHRVLAVALAGLALWLAALLYRSDRSTRLPVILATLVVLQIASGLALALTPAIPLALAHNLLAALMLAALAVTSMRVARRHDAPVGAAA